jgi:hypothetical protein
VQAAPEMVNDEESRSSRERLAGMLREFHTGSDADALSQRRDAPNKTVLSEGSGAAPNGEAAATSSVLDAVAAWANLDTDGQALRVADLLGRQWGTGRRGAEGEADDEQDALTSGKRKTATETVDELLLQFTKAEHVASVGFSVGLVWWLTRGGGLLASAMMGAPAWKQVDLLTIMSARDDDEEAAEDAEDESEEVNQLFEKQGVPG